MNVIEKLLNYYRYVELQMKVCVNREFTEITAIYRFINYMCMNTEILLSGTNICINVSSGYS